MIAGAIAVLLASARVIARNSLVACEACFVDLIFKHSLLVVIVRIAAMQCSCDFWTGVDNLVHNI